MGVVKRQGIKRSIVDYVGVAIGMISVFFIYPLVIEAYGTLSFLRSSGFLLASFTALGLDSISIRFFPQFRDDAGRHNGFFTFVLLIVFGVYVVLALIWLGFWDSLLSFFTIRSTNGLDVTTCFYLVLPLAFLLVLVKVLVAICANFQRIVIPGILNDLLVKVAVPAFCLLFLFQWISIEQLLQAYLGMYLFVVIGLFVYIKWLRTVKWVWPTQKVWSKYKDIGTFAAFNVLGSTGLALIQQMDVVMMGNLTDARKTGSYDLGLRLVSPLSIPQRAVMSITGPLVADGVRNEDWLHLKDIYQRAALNLVVFAALLFLLLLLNLHDLGQILPQGEIFQTLQPVIFILGLSTLFDMATSFNGHLISYSQYFRFNVIFIFVLGVLNAVLNFLLIPRYGMIGAALASAAALVGFNTAKLLFIRLKFGFWPFSWPMLSLVVIIVVLGVTLHFLPLPLSPLLAILLRSTLLVVSYLGIVWYVGVSADMNALIREFGQKIRAFRTRK